MKTNWFFTLLLLISYPGNAQGDNYLMRNMEYGKKVGPAVPPRAVYTPKPQRGLQPFIRVIYPVLPLRLYMEGNVWIAFDIGTDGLAKSVEFERLDSLIIGATDPKKVATYGEAGKQALIDAAKQAIYRLRLAPADSIRHYRFPFRYRIQ